MALSRMCDRLSLRRNAARLLLDVQYRPFASVTRRDAREIARFNPVSKRIRLVGGTSRIVFHRGFSSQSPADVIDSASDKVIKSTDVFLEDATPEKLLELTATYWRRLRCAKPLLLTCNIDKAVEMRCADAILATGATCHATTDINALLDKLTLNKESQGIIGCYINVDSFATKVDTYKEACESLNKCCNSIMVDISVPLDFQPAHFTRIDEMLALLKPDVIRFIHGTWQYFAAIAPEEMFSQLQENDTDMAKLNRCNTISERYNAVVIDCDMYPIMMNASDREGVVFPRSLSILKKIHGFDSMAGGVIAAMLSVSSSKSMLACITSIIGIDYSSEKCVDISEGPGTLAVNFVDKIHRISTSPDNLLKHDSPIKFLKRVNVPIDGEHGPLCANSE